ncbi:MAG: alpha/beta hydrolase [Anaerolineae bacterium]|nr:alpha/beta hydrolase [Anaerolineae bacterium]
MKRLGRWLGLSAAVVGLVMRLEYRSLGTFMFMSLKVFGGAFAPFVAFGGGLAALIGLLTGDRLALGSGLLGAGLMARSIRGIAAPHDGFTRAFGAGWEARIPPQRQHRMLPARWVGQMPEAPGVRFQRDLAFGAFPPNGAPLLCDLWQPPVETMPTGIGVIYLHGSGWHYLDKDCGTRTFFRHLARQGQVIMDVAYTLAPQADIFGMIGDVQRAIAWLKVNAAEYGVDPERIVLMGGSAGGQLSLLQAFTANSPNLQAADVTIDTSVCGVVSFYGPPDLRAFYDRMGEVRGWMEVGDPERRERALDMMAVFFNNMMGAIFPGGTAVKMNGAALGDMRHMITGVLGGSPEDVPELYTLASPITHVGPHCPPTLLLQGAHDIAVRPEPVRRLYAALQEAGVPSVYVEFPQTDHGFDLFLPQWAPAVQAATYDVERFLALL